MDGWMDGWICDLRPFNGISVVSGRLVEDNERLCATEPCLRLKRFLYPRIELGTGTSAIQRQAY